MTGLLEIREKLKLFYSKYEPFILPVIKFLLAFVALNAVNGKLGYMTQLDNVAAVLIVALMCSFLPAGAMIFFAMVFSLAHMYALSMEVALVGLCVYLVMFLIFFRFSPRNSLVVVLTPLLCSMNLSYVVPVAVGLLCGPAAAVSVGCGVSVYYLFETIQANESNISTLGEEETLAKIRLLIDGIVGNKGMLVIVAAFAVTVIVVYFIRRLSVDYAWTIAAVAGAMTNVVILLIGDLVYNINISVAGALLGSLLAILVAKVIEFFRFCVDYGRKEVVQFEDDEYYYYVKAIPKMTVSMSTKTVKRINSHAQSSREASVSRSGIPAGRGAQPSRASQTSRTGGRSVVTERTAAARKSYGTGSRTQSRSGDYRTGKSVTMGNAASAENGGAVDDYEELF